ncbi:MAG: zinc ABC transporter substrate-binding protein [bacterium]|nr:zinc ABC transporter substrate-binding protein [bacterium]
MNNKVSGLFGKSKRSRSYIAISVILFLIGVPADAAERQQLNVLTSFLPIYIFTKNVIGERKGVELTSLLPDNVGPHDYQMRPSDMRKVADADLIIINGLGLESFAEKILAEGRKKGIVFESAKGLPLLGASGEEEGDDHGHEGHHDHGGEFNPHIWVSPRLAAMQVQNIIEILAQADPDGTLEYRRNGAAYVEKLNALQTEMKKGLTNLAGRKIITVHSAFDYLARDLDLDLVGVVYHMPGEEPSASQISGLSRLIQKEGIKAIFSEPQFSDKMARLLAKETGAAVYMLDPIATGMATADYYEKVMRANLDTLKKALP